MESITCINCSSIAPAKAFFCPSCGAQIKCKKCSELLVKNAKACISCGGFLEQSGNQSNSNGAPNTVKYREIRNDKGFERSYDLAFTDHVSKEVGELFVNLAKTNSSTRALEANFDQDKILNDSSEKEEELNIDHGVVETSENPLVSKADSTIPPLNDIEMTLSSSEANWISIYAFYLANAGMKTFSKDQVYEAYKLKRQTGARLKNFSTNWKSLFNNQITTLKENEFRFTPEGIKIVTNLLTSRGSEKSKTPKPQARSKPLKSASALKTVSKSVTVEEFDPLNKVKTLAKLFDEKKPGENTGARILLIAYYIIKINKSEYFTEGNIDFAYRVLGLNKRPNFLHQTLLNLVSRKVWLNQIEGKEGAWSITRIGESFVDDKMGS